MPLNSNVINLFEKLISNQKRGGERGCMPRPRRIVAIGQQHFPLASVAHQFFPNIKKALEREGMRVVHI